MTDWHCPRCRRRVRLYHHRAALGCVWCGRAMHLGRGKGTTFDPWHTVRIGKSKRRAVNTEGEAWAP